MSRPIPDLLHRINTLVELEFEERGVPPGVPVPGDPVYLDAVPAAPPPLHHALTYQQQPGSKVIQSYKILFQRE